MLAISRVNIQISLYNQSKERKGKWVCEFLGILRKRERERERERELVLFGGFYLCSNFGLYSKENFLTERAEVSNGCLMEGSSDGLSDKV